MPSRPKVSIIIPVYNTAFYLKRCLDSVTRQTLRDIEIICVNDASKDDSPAILREYEAQDARITVIEFSENKGAAVARNTAVAAARGEYLGFVDSDDEVDLDFYEKLYGQAVKTGAAIVKGTLMRIVEERSIKCDYINDRIRNERFNFNYQFTTAIYNAEHIRKAAIDFPAGVPIGEEVAFLIKAVCLAPGVETVDGAFYRYHRRADSANSKLFSLAKIRSVLKAMNDVLGFINRHGIEARVYVYLLLWFFQRLPGLRRR